MASLDNADTMQFALPVTLPDDETFSSYFAGDNQEVVNHLQQLLTVPSNKFQYSYVYGGADTGKSHLLYACCVLAQLRGLSNILLSLEQLVSFGPEVLIGLEQYDVVCIDDLTLIAGDEGWERGLFNFYNMFNEAGKVLILADELKPEHVQIKLPDLKSRLQWGALYQLKALRDEQKQATLILRARLRGLELPEESSAFLLTRESREMSTLMKALDQLDQNSIRLQRRLTIPFIKETLNL